MFGRLRRGGTIAAALALAIVGAGATPALADPEETYVPSDAMLTKVIDAPAGTDTSQDTYVFHFAGGGVVDEVEEENEQGQSETHCYSGGVEQDTTTIKGGDVVPTIGDVELNGVLLTNDNTLTNGQMSQTVVQISLSEILNGVKFPHAGVYTYVVTEETATTVLSDGTYINASQAEYMLRIRVANAKTENNSVLGNKELIVNELTIQQTKNDNGAAVGEQEKVDPTYPKVSGDKKGKVTKTAENATPVDGKLAGDERGRNVLGFTFANEYIQSGSFVVKKLYDGAHSDRTRYSTVEVAIYSEAAKSTDATGSCLTYVIDGGGIDDTDNVEGGERKTLNGVYGISQSTDYMVEFGSDGWANIKAKLKEGSSIRITGVFGSYNDDYVALNHRDKRATLSHDGLIEGMQYFVIEESPHDYRPTGYISNGSSTSADPRVNKTGMTEVYNLGDNPPDSLELIPGVTKQYPSAFALYVGGSANGQDTTVFVVNTIDESKVSVTGILIENMPYILMVGGPLAIFALMFVSKRRRNVAA